MDNVINAARSLGKIIQADERYLRYMVAKQQNDEDTELQEKIAVFQDLRGALGERMKGENQDQKEIDDLNRQMRAAYGEIFQNENMNLFTKAKNEMDGLLNFVQQILSGASNGEDPDMVEYQVSGCGGGDCGSCSSRCDS